MCMYQLYGFLPEMNVFVFEITFPNRWQHSSVAVVIHSSAASVFLRTFPRLSQHSGRWQTSMPFTKKTTNLTVLLTIR